MGGEIQDVSGSELGVLKLLWETPSLSIRQIAEALHPRRAAARYPTVQKQIERLEAKGFVRRDRSLMVHLFSAAVGREELVGRRLDAVMDSLCGGSLAPVITHLLRTPCLNAQERNQLRQLIDQLPAPPKRKGSQGRKG